MTPYVINFNMGCFEMVAAIPSRAIYLWINFNMGCFEIDENRREDTPTLGINFNMGCFEIPPFIIAVM